MRPPLTADEREKRLVEYLVTLNKGQLAQFKLTRLNRITNFRRRFMDLLNELVETRAEDLAAGMLMEFAPERPKREIITSIIEKLPLRKAKKPVWLNDSKAISRRRRA